MCFIREVPTVVVAIADPLKSYADVGAAADSSVVMFIAGALASAFVLRLGAVSYSITAFLHRYACT